MAANQTLGTQMKVRKTMKMLNMTLVVIFSCCPVYVVLYGFCLSSK